MRRGPADGPEGCTRIPPSPDTPRAGGADAHPSSDVAVGDIDPLLCAVKDRLRTISGHGFVAACVPPAADPAEHFRAGVLECVAALDQLHLSLSHEFARRQQLERVVGEAQAALARVHSELVGGPAREREAYPLSTHENPTSLPNGGVATH